MTTISTDMRRITAERAPEAVARVREAATAMLATQVQLAKDLELIDRSAAYVFEGCSSLVQYAPLLGLDASLAIDLLWLGRAFLTTPDLEARVLGRELPLANACAVSRLLAAPHLVRAGEDWVQKAVHVRLRDLRRVVRLRVEEGRQGFSGLVEVSVLVTPSTRGEFERCQVVASAQAGQHLSDSQTFTRVVGHYLDSFDPLRRPAGTRRVGPTIERPADRYVPAEVDRALHARSGGRCEIPGCGRVATDRAHLRPHEGHRRGEASGREVDDLWHACGTHHVLFDAGILRFAGWGPDGKPRFEVTDGAGAVREALAPWGGRRQGSPGRLGSTLCDFDAVARGSSAAHGRGSPDHPPRPGLRPMVLGRRPSRATHGLRPRARVHGHPPPRLRDLGGDPRGP